MDAADPLARRRFLKTTGLLSGMLAAGTPLALLAPSRAWAVDLAGLTSSEGRMILMVSRTICPHDGLEDAAYAVVVKAVDGAAAKDPETLATLREGLRRIGAGFASADEPERVRRLKAVEKSTFFKTMRNQTLATLYTTPMAYAYFGYQGEAFSKGGYLFRGFNDLHWLPDVPLADSGPMPAEEGA